MVVTPLQKINIQTPGRIQKKRDGLNETATLENLLCKTGLLGRDSYLVNVNVILIAAGVTPESYLHIRRERIVRRINIYGFIVECFVAEISTTGVARHRMPR